MPNAAGIGGFMNNLLGAQVDKPDRPGYGGMGAEGEAQRLQGMSAGVQGRGPNQMDLGAFNAERARTGGYEGNMQDMYNLARGMATGQSNAAQATFHQGADQMAQMMAAGAASGGANPAAQGAAMRAAQQQAGAQGTNIANQAAQQQERMNQFGAQLAAQQSQALGQQGLAQQQLAASNASQNLQSANYGRMLNDQAMLGLEGLGQGVYRNQLEADTARMQAQNQGQMQQAELNAKTGYGLLQGAVGGASELAGAVGSDERMKSGMALDPGVTKTTPAEESWLHSVLQTGNDRAVARNRALEQRDFEARQEPPGLNHYLNQYYKDFHSPRPQTYEEARANTTLFDRALQGPVQAEPRASDTVSTIDLVKAGDKTYLERPNGLQIAQALGREPEQHGVHPEAQKNFFTFLSGALGRLSEDLKASNPFSGNKSGDNEPKKRGPATAAAGTAPMPETAAPIAAAPAIAPTGVAPVVGQTVTAVPVVQQAAPTAVAPQPAPMAESQLPPPKSDKSAKMSAKMALSSAMKAYSHGKRPKL